MHIINDSVYVLRPTGVSSPSDYMFMYNVNSGEILNTIDYSDDKWFYISWRNACLTDRDDRLMFYPDGISNCLYDFDKESGIIRRSRGIIFPETFIKPEDLPSKDNEFEYVHFCFTHDGDFLDNFFILKNYYVGLFRNGKRLEDYYVIVDSKNESTKANIYIEEKMILPIASVSYGNCLYAIDSSSNLSYCSYDFNQVVNNVSADDECYYLLKYTINSDVIK